MACIFSVRLLNMSVRSVHSTTQLLYLCHITASQSSTHSEAGQAPVSTDIPKVGVSSNQELLRDLFLSPFAPGCLGRWAAKLSPSSCYKWVDRDQHCCNFSVLSDFDYSESGQFFAKNSLENTERVFPRGQNLGHHGVSDKIYKKEEYC